MKGGRLNIAEGEVSPIQPITSKSRMVPREGIKSSKESPAQRAHEYLASRAGQDVEELVSENGGKREHIPRWESFVTRPRSTSRCRKPPKKNAKYRRIVSKFAISAFCLRSSESRAASTRRSFVCDSTTLTSRVRSSSLGSRVS